MALARKAVTLEELLELPEEKPALEYFDGEVQQKVSPSSPGAALTFKHCECINAFALPRKLARAFPELRATFAGESPVPDAQIGLARSLPFGIARTTEGPPRGM
jgi:hypothetical protein